MIRNTTIKFILRKNTLLQSLIQLPNLFNDSTQLNNTSKLNFFFFFNDPPPTEISPLPLPAALPILVVSPTAAEILILHRLIENLSRGGRSDDEKQNAKQCCSNARHDVDSEKTASPLPANLTRPDRKSTRLNSSHLVISYAVFCLKKK